MKRMGFIATTLMLSAVTLTGASAEALPENTIISKDNLQQSLDKTVDGTPVSDMLADGVGHLVSNYNLKLRIMDPTPWPRDPLMDRLTAANAGKIQLDPATKTPMNWVAGAPFPEVEIESDPKAGLKLIWNYTYGRQEGDSFYNPEFAMVLIDGTQGLDREQIWTQLSYKMVGRLVGNGHTAGNGTIFNKQLLFALQPHDIEGLGTFAIRYVEPKLNDTWAYVRTVRRIRRLSGGAWMDPIGGTDQLQDDFDIFNAHPAWYPSYKVLGRQKMLVSANNPGPFLKGVLGLGVADERFPAVNLGEAPYWNPIAFWEPREVYIIEATPPEYHPYSKKIIYMDAEEYSLFLGEFFDRKGERWKQMVQLFKVWGSPNNATPERQIVRSGQGHTIDLQRMHATMYILDPKFNDPTVEEDSVSLRVLDGGR
ncbi:MAG: DUF1329 domain-containing protein [Alphaproteobacteria bacterium]